MFKSFDDERGSLTPIEFAELPFFPVRAFYVQDVPYGVWRGGHAHYKTRQILVCLKGEIEYKLFDGYIHETGILHKNEHILVDVMVWDEQKFNTANSILLVLCNTSYDEQDYIRDYEQFLKTVKEFAG